MKEALLVFAGGGAGSVLRYLISRAMASNSGLAFPWGTFTVNVAGCLLLGLLIGWLGAGEQNTQMRLLLAVGFCGGFTTFSAFALENLRLLQTQPVHAALYMGASLLTGIAAVGLGLFLAGLRG